MSLARSLRSLENAENTEKGFHGSNYSVSYAAAGGPVSNCTALEPCLIGGSSGNEPVETHSMRLYEALDGFCRDALHASHLTSTNPSPS